MAENMLAEVAGTDQRARELVKGDVCILQFLTLGNFQFSKRKSLIDHGDSDNINNKHQFYGVFSLT